MGRCYGYRSQFKHIRKIANGLCDNLVTCIARAWDPGLPLIVCPAMNTYMWEHPLTENHIRTLTEVCGYRILEPVSKRLACGDIGKGAMVSVEMIVDTVNDELERLVRSGERKLKWTEQAQLTSTEVPSKAIQGALSIHATVSAKAYVREHNRNRKIKQLENRIVESPSAPTPMSQQSSRQNKSPKK